MHDIFTWSFNNEFSCLYLSNSVDFNYYLEDTDPVIEYLNSDVFDSSAFTIIPLGTASSRPSSMRNCMIY